MSRLVNPFIYLAQVKQKSNEKFKLIKLTIICIIDMNLYIPQSNNKVGLVYFSARSLEHVITMLIDIDVPKQTGYITLLVIYRHFDLRRENLYHHAYNRRSKIISSITKILSNLIDSKIAVSTKFGAIYLTSHAKFLMFGAVIVLGDKKSKYLYLLL